jgi:hypothetical protein
LDNRDCGPLQLQLKGGRCEEKSARPKASSPPSSTSCPTSQPLAAFANGARFGADTLEVASAAKTITDVAFFA